MDLGLRDRPVDEDEDGIDVVLSTVTVLSRIFIVVRSGINTKYSTTTKMLGTSNAFNDRR